MDKLIRYTSRFSFGS